MYPTRRQALLFVYPLFSAIYSQSSLQIHSPRLLFWECQPHRAAIAPRAEAAQDLSRKFLIFTNLASRFLKTAYLLQNRAFTPLKQRILPQTTPGGVWMGFTPSCDSNHRRG